MTLLEASWNADLWKDSDIFIYLFVGKVGSSIAMLDLLQVRKGDLILGNCKITVEMSTWCDKR